MKTSKGCDRLSETEIDVLLTGRVHKITRSAEGWYCFGRAWSRATIKSLWKRGLLEANFRDSRGFGAARKLKGVENIDGARHGHSPGVAKLFVWTNALGKSVLEEQSVFSNGQEGVSEAPYDLPDISGWQSPLLMVAHFGSESEKVLETFFEILSINLEGKDFNRTSMIIFRHDERYRSLKTFYAIVLDQPEKTDLEVTVDHCLDAWHECGGGELIGFSDIVDKEDWSELFQTELDDLAEPNWQLTFGKLIC